MNVAELERWIKESPKTTPLTQDAQQSTCLWFLEHQDEYKNVDLETQRIHQYARFKLTAFTLNRKHYREQLQHQGLEESGVYERYPAPDSIGPIQRALELIELASMKHRDILIARYIYGYSLSECGKLLNMPTRTVHKYEQIALQRIRERLEAYG